MSQQFPTPSAVEQHRADPQRTTDARLAQIQQKQRTIATVENARGDRIAVQPRDVASWVVRGWRVVQESP